MKLEVRSITRVKDKGKPRDFLIIEYDKAFRDWICGSEGWERLTKKRLQVLMNFALDACLKDWLEIRKENDEENN
tara:strand:- start:19956 stop:20180 length:225 start_codon:yes stop_codon:yes gene_type:complete